jgi:hypothetical protein
LALFLDLILRIENFGADRADMIKPTFSRLFKTKNNIAEKRNQGTAKSNFVYT